MAKKNRTCICCKTKYSYCPDCGGVDKYKPTWMVEFHDENCMKIWEICTRFNMELMSKEEAQEALLECDLSKQDTFVDFVQKDIMNIFAEEHEVVTIE